MLVNFTDINEYQSPLDKTIQKMNRHLLALCKIFWPLHTFRVKIISLFFCNINNYIAVFLDK